MSYPRKFEYRTHMIETMSIGEDFDEAEWLNTLGETGWEVIGDTVRHAVPSGMHTPDGQDIPKFRTQVLAKRAVFS